MYYVQLPVVLCYSQDTHKELHVCIFEHLYALSDIRVFEYVIQCTEYKYACPVHTTLCPAVVMMLSSHFRYNVTER